MTSFYVAAAVLSGLTVVLLIVGVTYLLGTSSQVGTRLETYTAGTMPLDEGEEKPPDFSDRINTFIGTRSFAESYAVGLGRAGVKLTVPEYLLIKIGMALLPFLVFALVTRWISIGLVVGVLCFFIPDVWLKRRQRARESEFAAQLPETLDSIVGGLRAGFSLQHSMANVARTAPEPTASEFQRLTQEIQLGVHLMEALDHMALRINNDDLAMIVSVFKIHSRVGGNLAAILETVGTTIRERVRLRREIRVLTSMQRMSGYILGALPPFLTLVLFLINPSYMMEMFQWNIWLCIPVFATISMTIGFLVIRKLVDIKV